ncbi:uncharacterized protein [Paramisgurnus dabryanus]|uniref:uncharacterized protein isoform X2 n=1 Tax=Paramisgurnus dabryanus TaxID=90735 RepID=UPI0031F3F477
MAESGDSRSVQSESKPKIESDGDNDRHDQHSSLVKEMTQKTTDSDSEEDGDNLQSNKNSNAKVDKENDIENKQRPEGVTEELTNRSLVTEQQEDTIHSNTRTITKENIQMDNEPIIERTEGKTEDIIDTSTDIQEQDDSSQFDQNATTEKDIKMDNEPRERTEDVVTPKTAAGESDQKEDGMTKKDIDTSKDSQQQEDSSRSNTSTRAMEDIHMCSEPKEITKETTEKVTDMSTDTQEQDDSSKSKTSTITEKENEPRKRTEERPEEDIYRSTDTQEEEEEDSSQSNTSAMDDKQMDNEPMERTEVTPKTAAGPFDTSPDIKQHEESSQEDMEDNESIKRKEDIRWWILAGVAIILAIGCAALYNPESTSPVQKENDEVEMFTEKLNKVESSFPNQRPELWRRSRLHISRHLKTASPTEPVSLILTSGHGAERTLGCLAKCLAEAFSTARNSSVLNIYGKSKSLQDSDQVKLDIDNDLRKAFDGEKLAAVIHRFEELPPGSTLIFYRYCDHENAAYKNVLLVFTVMLDAELEITDNISLGRVEDMVHDQLIRKFVSSDKSALFNQMDVDKLSGLWSRISHLILPVAAEEESIQQGCGLESF